MGNFPESEVGVVNDSSELSDSELLASIQDDFQRFVHKLASIFLVTHAEDFSAIPFSNGQQINGTFFSVLATVVQLEVFDYGRGHLPFSLQSVHIICTTPIQTLAQHLFGSLGV